MLFLFIVYSLAFPHIIYYICNQFGLAWQRSAPEGHISESVFAYPFIEIRQN